MKQLDLIPVHSSGHENSQMSAAQESKEVAISGDRASNDASYTQAWLDEYLVYK